MILIEDNAHGFGGVVDGKKLGTFGDIGFNSLRKTLNLLSGGQLIIKNSKDYEISQAIKLLSRFKVSKINLLLNMIINWNGFLKSYLRFFIKKQPRFWDPYAFSESKAIDLRIDLLSEKKLKTTNFDNLFKKLYFNTFS